MHCIAKTETTCGKPKIRARLSTEPWRVDYVPMLDVDKLGQSVRSEAFKSVFGEYIGATWPVMGINGL